MAAGKSSNPSIRSDLSVKLRGAVQLYDALSSTHFIYLFIYSQFDLKISFFQFSDEVKGAFDSCFLVLEFNHI